MCPPIYDTFAMNVDSKSRWIPAEIPVNSPPQPSFDELGT